MSPRQKGRFSGLPVTASYPAPRSRRLPWALAAVAVAVALGVLAFDFAFGDAGLVSNGPLSSAHANLEADCGACHRGFANAESARCSVCHERFGDRLGVYTHDAHYLYRSGDFQRVSRRDHEAPCASCHTEHRGRAAAIAAVADAQCVACHDFGSFASGHPEFDVAAASVETPGLLFPHAHHVREVMSRQQLADVERACLYCHNPRPDGRAFEPLSFDRHCDACHLGPTVATPELPIATAAAPGVETVETIAGRRGPGSSWLAEANPRGFRGDAQGLRKSPLRHRDPWILDNLRRLRQTLYPGAELADLLVASPEIPPNRTLELYAEAVATLRGWARELRSRPERSVQRELRQIEALLDRVERSLADPYTALDESRFVLDLLSPDPRLDPEAVAAIEGVVAGLTEPCRQCHLVEHATIARVQADQRGYRRAEFDHRAHILSRRCLDCHTKIPITDLLAAETAAQAVIPAVASVSVADSAEIANLPSIETCRSCHNSREVSSGCITCHLFHPDQSRRSELLLYLEPP